MVRWGLVGLGRAGMARRRVLEAHTGCRLVCESSRRDPDSISFGELLDREIDAVALVENLKHMPRTRWGSASG